MEKYKIKSKPKYFIFLCIYFFIYPLCKLLYGRKNNWLICERGNDAQDNGFIFFKYIRENHPEIKITYLIKKNSPEYEKVSKIGKCVEYCSFKHFLMTIGCPVKISSQLFGYAPWIVMTEYFRRNKTHHKHVFLQHGITKNELPSFHGDVCRSLDLFVCGAKPEYEFIRDTFKYVNDAPQYTGFARYDNLLKTQTKNQILIMPTWRRYLTNLNDEQFLKTDFYKKWNELLTNEEFLHKCKSLNIKVIFYPHYEIQKFARFFTNNDVVDIINFGKITVQQLLKESKLLITDFSSVYFDFAFMHKPTLYYQFDEDDYYRSHYDKGYFDYRRDGFGDVCISEGELIKSINQIFLNNFLLEQKYIEQIDKFFAYHDDKNCERIFYSILNLSKK